MKHSKFNYNSLEELRNHINELKLEIPTEESIKVLSEPITIGNKIVPNRLAIHPMEGCDGTEEGNPSDLTFRRYKRFAESGAGLLWFEAAAVVKEGRANPRQLMVCKETFDEMKKLVKETDRIASENFGEAFKPFKVLQLTHSGRYSKPTKDPVPSIAINNPYLDYKLPNEYKIITDEELMKLEDKYVEAAVLAKDMGFDAVDIKSCHRYLGSELLSAHTREGIYGGSFENRTRFLLNIIEKIKEKLGNTIEITLRMNAYDAIPYPYGFGVDKKDFNKPDLEEPIKLLNILKEKGINLINISIGNPYYNPHVGRPYDIGPYVPPHHPLESINKALGIISELQKAVPEIAVIGTELSWLRQFGANVAAAAINDGVFSIAGFGRQAFAYPTFAKDILEKGEMDSKKCCIACSKCTELMRYGSTAGCVIRDSSVYAPIYKKAKEGKPSLVGLHEADHV